MKQKYAIWNFLCALDDENRLVLGAWTVMQKSVLISWDNYHTVKTHYNNKNTNLLKNRMNKVCYTECIACCGTSHFPNESGHFSS